MAKYKTTWMHSRSKHWHKIEFVIVRQRDMKDVQVTLAMTGAECWTDHRLVRSTMNLYNPLPYRNRSKTVRASCRSAKLKSPSHLEEFQRLLDEKFPVGFIPSGDSTDKWPTFKNAITATAKEALGPKARLHLGWFNENNKSNKQLPGLRIKLSQSGRTTPHQSLRSSRNFRQRYSQNYE